MRERSDPTPNLPCGGVGKGVTLLSLPVVSGRAGPRLIKVEELALHLTRQHSRVDPLGGVADRPVQKSGEQESQYQPINHVVTRIREGTMPSPLSPYHLQWVGKLALGS